MISCLSVEPLVILEFPTSEVVDAFPFDAKEREDDRALNPGRIAELGARWLGRLGEGEKDLCEGGGVEPEGAG